MYIDNICFVCDAYLKSMEWVNVDMRQLRYFLAIAHEGQITRAAKQLNMEQPPLSRQLKLIEQELGVVLFDRNGKRLQLTQAGEMLRNRALALMKQFEETITYVQELGEGVQGVLSIGAVVSCVSLLPSVLRKFTEKYPQVTFKIQEGDHFLLGELLENRDLEFIVTRLPFQSDFQSQHYSVLPCRPTLRCPASDRMVPAEYARDVDERAGALPFSHPQDGSDDRDAYSSVRSIQTAQPRTENRQRMLQRSDRDFARLGGHRSGDFAGVDHELVRAS